MAACIKGATIVSTLGVIRELADSDQLKNIIASCPPETQQLLRRSVMAVEWVTLDAWSPLLLSIWERIVGRDEKKFRRVMRAVCKMDFSGVYRVYVQNSDAETMLAKMNSIWSAYFDSGSLTLGPAEPKVNGPHWVLELRGLDSAHPIHLVVVQAYIEQILSMVGAKDAMVRRVREGRRDNRLACDYLIACSPAG